MMGLIARRPINNSRMPWDIFTKFSVMIHLYPRWVGIVFQPNWKSNMAARQSFWKTMSTQLLKNVVRYLFQTFTDDLSLNKVGWDCISAWSKFQYGRQGAILKKRCLPNNSRTFWDIFAKSPGMIHLYPKYIGIVFQYDWISNMPARQPFCKMIFNQ